MHSYNSPAPLASTPVATKNQLQSHDEVFALPTVQGVQAVQGFNKNSDSTKQLCLLDCESERGNRRTHPPILFVDDELPTASPFLVEPVENRRFKLYASDIKHQEYAGHYYDFEIAYFLTHWPHPPAPSVAEFMSVAEQVVSRGYVPPSQMSAEQIQALKGVA